MGTLRGIARLDIEDHLRSRSKVSSEFSLNITRILFTSRDTFSLRFQFTNSLDEQTLAGFPNLASLRLDLYFDSFLLFF